MTNETKREATIKGLGLTVDSEFVPWSKSRNFHEGANQKDLSLNWRVTLRRNGREILTTDYSAGIAHCPAYEQRPTIYVDNRIRTECENGFAVQPNSEYTVNHNKPIQPDTHNVIYSLLTDSDVIDHQDFESWAKELGFDPDSRKAEKTYNDCMKIALKFRSRFTSDEINGLREAFQDY